MRAASGIRHPELLAYREEFPLLSACTYLNTCSLGARSRRSDGRLSRVLEQWDRRGARAWYEHWLDELGELRDGLGWTIGRPGSEVALHANVSSALAMVASSLQSAHAGGRPRVVTTALDFPTVGHQWLARAPLGVELVVIPSPDGTTMPLAAFAEAVDEATALVATAHVYFTTGAVQEVARLASLCHERGTLLLIDGYQATGLLATDALALGIDFYVSGTLKWLLGGPGTAFLWVRPDLAARLEPTTTGWFGSARQFDFDVTSLDFATGGRRFELGTPSVPSAAIARGGLEMVREIGLERISERTAGLGDLTIRLAREAGLRVREPGGRRAGIVTIAVDDPEAVVEALAERGIIVDYRPGIVRVSPAFYNTEEEVEQAVAAISDLGRS